MTTSVPPADIDVSRSEGTVTIEYALDARTRWAIIWSAWLALGSSLMYVSLLEFFEVAMRGGGTLKLFGHTGSAVVMATIVLVGLTLCWRYRWIWALRKRQLRIAGGQVSFWRPVRGLDELEMGIALDRSEIHAISVGPWKSRVAVWFQTDRGRFHTGAGLPAASLAWLRDFIAGELAITPNRETTES